MVEKNLLEYQQSLSLNLFSFEMKRSSFNRAWILNSYVFIHLRVDKCRSDIKQRDKIISFDKN
jgi:hypothetical protein